MRIRTPLFSCALTTSVSRPLEDELTSGFYYRYLGLFISEALHPFLVLTKAGFEVDFAGEQGSYVADHLSTTEDYLNGEDRKIYENKNSDFRSRLDNLKRPSDVNADEVSWFGSELLNAGRPY